MTVAVAVLLACFNRREITLRCLRQIHSQLALEGVTVSVFLVDDGSTDGTSEAVAEEFPTVTLMHGDGSLYWTGGMRRADAMAWKEGPDFLLWLNDDVALEPNAIRQLVDAAEATNRCSVIVGSVRDPLSGRASYGGYLQTDKNRPLKLTRVEPNDSIQRVDTMNGNVVLVPASVRESIGPPDLAFSHNMADMDYAFRARQAGWGVHVAPRFVGSCETNTSKAKWKDPSVPLRVRLRHVVSRKGLPPREWYRFTRRYCGWRWPRYFIGPYTHATVCGLLRRRRS